MLGKLLKYEIRATSRIYLPLLGVLLALAGTDKVFLSVSKQSHAAWAGYVSAALSVVFVLTMIALSIASLIVTIQRFYRSLLGDEGYLMFTLPVSADHLILSKLIAAAMWVIVTGLAAVCSIAFLLMKGNDWSELARMLPQLNDLLWSQAGIRGWSIVAGALLAIVAGVFYEILLFYASMSLGHLSNKRRFLCSVGSFIGLNVAIQLITTALGVENLDYIKNRILENMTAQGALWVGIGALLLYEIAMGTALFFLSRGVLRNRLNLQ